MRPVALIIDPHRDTRELYIESFGAEGWDTLEADNGATGLGLAMTHTPSAVISEFRLPTLDGGSIIRILRADERTHTLPIVVVTADARVLSDAWQCGANAVLLKPTTPDRILLAVHNELRRRSALILHASGVLQQRASRAIRESSVILERRDTLSRRMGRFRTTAPPNVPPSPRCDRCDQPLEYAYSFVGGVNAHSREQWDYFECPTGCGTFQYRHRGRRLQRVE